MKKALYLTLTIAAVVMPANAAPQLFFSKTDLPSIRVRVEKPEHAKKWQAILTLTPMAKGFAGGRGDTMYGLALGMDLLSECLTPEERAIVVPACRDYLNVFVKEFNNPKVWWYRIHNYNGVNGGAAGCLALTLRDDFPEESPVWIAEAMKIVERWLSTGFDADGAGIEGIGYAAYGLGNSTVFGNALRRNGMDDFFGHPLYKKFPVFLALSKLPGERAEDKMKSCGPMPLLDVSCLRSCGSAALLTPF